MYHKQNLLFAKKYQKILVLCTVFFLIFTSVGLASFSSEFILDNEAIVRAGKDIRIINVSFSNSSNGGYANYGDYPKVNNNLENNTEIYKNYNSSSILLSNGFANGNSTITYTFTVKNNTSTDYFFDTISINPGRIDVSYNITTGSGSSLKTLEVGDKINAGATFTGSITCSTTGEGSITEVGNIYFTFNYAKRLTEQMILDERSGYNESSNITYIKNKAAPDLRNRDTGNSGLYASVDDYGDTFYYKGRLANNYVEFNSIIWRIIRRNGDKSVRLAYSGLVSDYTKDGNGRYTAAPTTTAKVSIQAGKYNTSNSKNRVGYMYSDTTTNFDENTNDSTLKQWIDNYYVTNFSYGILSGDNLTHNVDSMGIPVQNYLADSLFCNDRNGAGTGATFDFPSVARINNLLNNGTGTGPTFMCSRKIDRFTVDDTNVGNGALTYPMATFTMDEAVFSGLGNTSYSSSNNPFLGPPSSGNIVTMTPSRITSGPVANVFSLQTGDGGRLTNSAVGNYNFYVRPVINISRDVYVESGNGTLATPYKLMLQVTSPTITQAVTKIKFQQNTPVENLVTLGGGNTFDLVVKNGNTVITNTASLSLGIHTLSFTATNEYNISTTRNFNFEVIQLNNSCYITGPSEFQRNPTFSIHVENPSQLTSNPYKFNNDNWSDTNTYIYSGGPLTASIKDTNFGEIHCGGTVETQRKYQRYSCLYSNPSYSSGPLHIVQPGEFEGCVSLSLYAATCTKIYRVWCGGYDGEAPIVWKDPDTGEIYEYGRPDEVAMCGYGDYPDRVIGESDFISFSGTCTPIGEPTTTSCGGNNISQDAYDRVLEGTRCEEEIKYKVTNDIVDPTITQLVTKIHYGSNLNTNKLVNVTGGNYLSLIVKEGNTVINSVNSLSLGNHTLTFIATNEYNRTTTQYFTFSVETLTNSCTVTGPSTYEMNPTFTITVSNSSTLTEEPYRFNSGSWQADNTFSYSGGSFSASINDMFLGIINCSGTVTTQNMYRRGTCTFAGSGSSTVMKQYYYQYSWINEYSFYRNTKIATCNYNSSGSLTSSEGPLCPNSGYTGTWYRLLSTTMNRTTCSSWTDWTAGSNPGFEVSYCADSTHCTAYIYENRTHYKIN